LRHEDGSFFDLISHGNNRWLSAATNVSGKQLKKIYEARYLLNKGVNYEYYPIYNSYKVKYKKMPYRGKAKNYIKY